MQSAISIWRRPLMQVPMLAIALALRKVGKMRAARMTMSAITMSSSIGAIPLAV